MAWSHIAHIHTHTHISHEYKSTERISLCNGVECNSYLLFDFYTRCVMSTVVNNSWVCHYAFRLCFFSHFFFAQHLKWWLIVNGVALDIKYVYANGSQTNRSSFKSSKFLEQQNIDQSPKVHFRMCVYLCAKRCINQTIQTTIFTFRFIMMAFKRFQNLTNECKVVPVSKEKSKLKHCTEINFFKWISLIMKHICAEAQVKCSF